MISRKWHQPHQFHILWQEHTTAQELLIGAASLGLHRAEPWRSKLKEAASCYCAVALPCPCVEWCQGTSPSCSFSKISVTVFFLQGVLLPFSVLINFIIFLKWVGRLIIERPTSCLIYSRYREENVIHIFIYWTALAATTLKMEGNTLNET